MSEYPPPQNGPFGRGTPASDDVIVVRRDRTRTTVDVTGDIEGLTGWDRDTFADRLYSIVHPEDQRLLFAMSRRLRDEGEPAAAFDLRVVSPDGTVRIFRCTVTNRLDDPRFGDLHVMLVRVGEDSAPSQRHAGLLAAANDLVIIQDRDRRTEYVSPSVERLLGVTADHLVQHWTEIMHADDVAVFQRVREQVAAEPDGHARVRLRGVHADGTPRTFDMAITNRFDDGVIDGLLLSARDVTAQVATEDRLLETEARFEALVDNGPDVSLLLDESGTILFCSAGVEGLLGHTPEQVIGANVATFVHPDEVALAMSQIHRLTTGEPTPDNTLRVRRADGSFAWIDTSAANRLDVPALGALVLTLRDVSDRVDAEQRMLRLTEVLEGTTDMVCIYDADLEMIWANGSATRALRDAPRSLFDQAPAAARQTIEREVLPALSNDGSWRGELAITAPDGRLIPTEATILTHRGDGAHVEFISVISRDISERKALEARLSARARQDPLTGLANRTRLTERLHELMDADVRFALAFIDLDNFKTVNDTQGHDVGDQLLLAFASRLRAALRPSDHVARFGGDEFVVLLADVGSDDQAERLTQRILDRVRGTVRAGSTEVFITASAGVARSADTDPATLVSNADAAMYQAKERGRDQVAVFSPELRVRNVRRHETSRRLRSAIEDHEIDVWFQPIVDTATTTPVSVEALARWEHPDLGMVPPSTFIEIAEETGLIIELGAAIIRRTCAAIAELAPAVDAYTFAINLSAHQLADPNLPDILERSLRDHGLSGRRLVCELTESAVMQDVTTSAKMLDELRLLGVGIAVDDFGTGYSSLAYLHRFPVDILKIDREFVAGLSYAIEWDRSLVAGIISLAHSLGISVVAEGVETEEQADILGMLGCDAMQGYLFARPTPLASLAEVLDRLHAAGRA